MRSKLLLTLATIFLLAAFPTLGLIVFGLACSVISGVIAAISLAKAHLTFICCLAAVALFARAYPAVFPRAGRWLARAVADSVASVMPQKTDNT
jgi:hypothetical protein